MVRAVTAAVALAAGFALVAGCSDRPPVHHLPGPHSVPAAAAYWNRIRLLGALPLMDNGGRIPLPGESADSRPTASGESLRVGALFVHSASGNHFWTASVVSSPGKDLLITAAHCIDGGKGGGYRPDIGVIQPPAGHSIEAVPGADQLGTDQRTDYLVHVTGYPDSANAPISCVNWTSEQSSTQLRFECGGYTGGTSGSPWVAHFSTRSRTGTIVGVIGGYEEGGNTPSVSYSVRFGTAVQSLYQQAIATASAAPSPGPGSPSASART